MKYEEWELIYHQIVEDLGMSIDKDERAASVLNELIKEELRIGDPDQWLSNAIAGKNALIIGPCIPPSELKDKALSEKWDNEILVTSVGLGTKHALEVGIIPDIVLTDLDKSPVSDIMANENGAIAVIHAHGDNMGSLRAWVPRFQGKVIPTCQCAPIEGIYNWGGFTDGDRAYSLLRHFNAAEISLIGFDFEKPCETDPGDVEIKKKKLAWAEKIINKL